MAKSITNAAIETLVAIYKSIESHYINGQGDGWVFMASFGARIKKAGFNIKEYGYSKLLLFIQATNAFEIYTDSSNTIPVNHIRLSINSNSNNIPYLTISPKSSESSLDNPQIMDELKGYYKELLEDAEISSPEVVGFYETDKEGNYQFSDIRDALFHEHKYPKTKDNSDREIIIHLDGPINTLKLNRYYKFSWIVTPAKNSRGYVLDIDKSKPVRRINPIELTNTLHELWNDRSHGQAMSSAMQTISSELMASSDGTFIYELLQNANDYPKADKNGNAIPVEVEFHMTDKYLICRHSGSVFSPRDVASICSIGNGSKTKNKNAIGYKGIGFKTVFHAHDWVYVNTGDYSFRFDKHSEKEGRPFQIMPIWTSNQDLADFDLAASTLVQDGKRDFSVQTIMMPRNAEYLYGMDKSQESDEKSHEFVLRDMFKDIRDIVFIPNINTVKVFFPNEEPIICSKGESLDWVISVPYVHKLDPDKEQKEIVNECDQHPERRIPPKYKAFEDTYVSFAAKKNGKIVLPVEDATVNCYLPTKAEFGFPFLMNTDMVPSGDRSQLKLDVKFNQLFARIAGHKFVSWINQLLIDGYEPASVFNLIPDFNSVKEGVGKQYKVFIECFEAGFNEALKIIPIIPVEGTAELQLPSNVLRDVTGFSAKKIISQDKFLDYANHKDLYLPLASICNNDRLVRILNDSSECVKFRDSNLVAFFANENFKKDLLEIEINAKVIEFILDYTYKDNYKELSMFINHMTGELSKSSDLFLDIDDDRKYLSAFESQLDFLSTKTREILKNDSSEQNNYIEKLKTFNWATYAAYSSVIKPLFETSQSKDENISLLKCHDTNLDIFRFIGKHQIKGDVIKSFPILLSDGQYGTLKDTCFFYSNDAVELRNSQWVDSSWYSVISQTYDTLDSPSEDKVKTILEHFGVLEFSSKTFYDKLIKNNNTRIDHINQKSSSDLSICTDFLTFLFGIWNEKEIGTFNHFLIPVVGKDGISTYKSGKDVTIFLYNLSTYDVMAALLNKNWVSDGMGYILDSRCHQAMAVVGGENINKIFKEKFSLKESSTESFCQNIILKNISDIIKNITPIYRAIEESQDIIDKRKNVKVNNLDFFKFVCDNYASIFVNGTNPFHNSGYPFCLCNNEEYQTKPGKYYSYSLQALDAASQDWLPNEIMGVIDAGYSDITSIFSSAKELYALLKVSDFSYSSFLKEDVSSNKGAITRYMDTVEKNVSFHCYFKANRNSFSPEEREILKNFPVFVVSDELPKQSMTSTSHYVRNNQVVELVKSGYGTAGTTDMILADYFDDENADKDYWIDILGNKQFTFPEIATWMITKSKDVISGKTAELDGNILFWQLVKKLPGASNKENQKSLKSLRVFPIYARKIKDESYKITVLDASEQCYVSDSYFIGGGGVEFMLKEYAVTSFVVSGDYIEDSVDETVASWKKFWESAGFLSSNEELIINTIIPNLDKPENRDEKIPLLLFQNKAIIDKHLSDTSNPERVEKLKADLNKLYIKTNWGLRPISESVFIQKNDYVPYSEPMVMMPLLAQVYNYTDEQYSFFMSIGERAGSKIIKDQNSWRLEKIIQFSSLEPVVADIEENDSSVSYMRTSECDGHKLPFDYETVHFQFVRELAQSFSQFDLLQYGSYIRNIQLYNRKGKLCQPTTLTEGSVYSPYCDFEACGLIEELNYISDNYAGFTNISGLLRAIGVHYFFWEEDIPLLKNQRFATYFWNQYMADSVAREKVKEWIIEGKFKNTKCVPTIGGVKPAEELYNTFGTFGKEDLSSYVNLLKDGQEFCSEGIVESFQDKNDEKCLYPNPIGLLDFICVLSKEHCFEYLMNSKVEHTAKRRYVLAQLLKYKKADNLPDDDVETYRKSEHANWLNGKKDPAHISALYAIGRQAEDKYYLRHFGNNPLIISNDTISDDDTSFEEICTSILKVKILHGGDNSDFYTKPSSDSFDETEQIRHALYEKSLLLSTIINAPEGEDWKEAYDKYVSEITLLNFVKCSSISIECKDNPDISKSDVDAFFYDKATKTFYYLKDWQHKFVFDSMWRKLIEVLDIPGGNDEMTIKKILDKDLESHDVDHLIQEYCTNFYEDETFVDLLSSLYPETSERLNIKPNVDEDKNDVKPHKLVSFSQNREEILTTQEDIFENNVRDINESPSCSEELITTQKQETSFVSEEETQNEDSTNTVEVFPSQIDDVIDERLEGIDRNHIDLQDDLHNTSSPIMDSNDTPSASIGRSTIDNDDKLRVKSSHVPQPNNQYDNSEDETIDTTLEVEENILSFDPDKGERIGSISKDKDYQPLGSNPIKPRSARRIAKPFTKDEVNRLRSNGTPLELETLPATNEELDILAQCGISPEQIADTNYLAQLRLYCNLRDVHNEEPEESLSEFVRNANDVAEHKMKSGKYIHACSAARGVMYIGPSVWNKMVDDKWIICVYLDGEGKNFHYINSSEEFLKLVEKDDIVIKITGKEKIEVIKDLYSGILEDVKGTAYTLIRVAARTNMDAVFAHYVGAMAEPEDGNDDTSDF